MVKLTPQEQQEAERMFRIRRHIYDSRNIKDTLLYDTQTDFGICYDESVSLSGLSDQDKFALVVIIKDLSDYGTVRSDYKAFGWKKEYVSDWERMKHISMSEACSIWMKEQLQGEDMCWTVKFVGQ